MSGSARISCFDAEHDSGTAPDAATLSLDAEESRLECCFGGGDRKRRTGLRGRAVGGRLGERIGEREDDAVRRLAEDRLKVE